jgi:hypothetical protein
VEQNQQQVNMKYRIISNKLYQINDDDTLTELSNFNSKTNFITEIRKHTEKPIKEEKNKKDKEEKNKKDKEEKDKEEKDKKDKEEKDKEEKDKKDKEEKDKEEKDKEEKDKKIKTKDNEIIPTILEIPKKKRGRPKK